jgi:hypothetical protein
MVEESSSRTKVSRKKTGSVLAAIFFFAIVSIFNDTSRMHQATRLFFSDEDSNAVQTVTITEMSTDPDINRKTVMKKSFLLLNETKSLLTAVPSSTNDMPSSAGRGPPRHDHFSIDVLVVGSQFKLSAARKQFQTWGSHSFVRNFIVSTEYDDPIPDCNSNTTIDDVARISQTCKGARFWRSKNAFNPLTKHWLRAFGRIQWLKKKKNPAGWVCAQRRFISSLTRVIDLYHADDIYPDYLIVADDDTYMNLENVTDYLLLGPQRLKEERGIEDDEMYVPTPISPTIFAGCRVRSGLGGMIWTIPYGGFGTFLSQGAMKRLTQSIHCDGSVPSTEYEQAICDKYLHNYTSRLNSYPFSATIGEEAYFQSGDSLNQVFMKYTNEIDYFCLHSDWFFGYIANFLNVSRHVNHKGELPIMGHGRAEVGRSMFDEDENTTHYEVNRLHTLMSSEFSRYIQGNCIYSNDAKENDRTFRRCVPNATICHYVAEEDMEKLYIDSGLS